MNIPMLTILKHAFISLGQISRNGSVGSFVEVYQISLSRKDITRSYYKKTLFLYTFPKPMSAKLCRLCPSDR